MSNEIIEYYEKKIDNLDIDAKLKTALKKKVSIMYPKMSYDHGEAVGVVAAQSISEPATQTTLKSYHRDATAGLEITQGLPRILEIFDGRREPKTPSMKILLLDDYNNVDGAKLVAANIRETVLKQVVYEDAINLVNMNIEFTFDKAQLKILNLSLDEISKGVKKAIKNIEVKIEGDKVIVEPKKANITVKDLQSIRVKARLSYVKGIKGITHTVIENDSNTWIIHTLGSNLKKVLKIAGVDTYNTKTNNIFEIQEVMGIEASRNAIINELLETMRSQGVDTDIRHIMLVADAMTSHGKVYAIGRYGLSGIKSSVLARANFEETVKHLINASAEDVVDVIDGVVENVIIGKTAKVGTGLVNLVIKKTDK
ncbi:MAG: DNA-directed RNA polymerase subunit A'' [DPANN group archaeon]|nr:DNA-directed RNA polymerase subunit A'' [DPANN group archaeon]